MALQTLLRARGAAWGAAAAASAAGTVVAPAAVAGGAAVAAAAAAVVPAAAAVAAPAVVVGYSGGGLAGRRGTKNFDWYNVAMAEAAAAKTAVEAPPFPPELTPGRKRARAFIDFQFGADAAPAAAPAAAAPADAAAAAPGAAVSRVVVELADDLLPLTCDNFLQVRTSPY